ncbi:hypothetical protein BB987_14440 [Photorhabdus temperata]|uniref:Lipoprotein n=1 Tax=Photorhabdus khanii NC19 TaxID=1004151 RepID=W3VF97_9GAMM|nr:hypothetical protein [Photorhabdus khanii]ETS33704.1 hypothetical protein PTE_00881 [Photorhabdus khanii NC19]OHV52433.1 hypothetical protein BB987_14440 [Photorhabdus temperata]
MHLNKKIFLISPFLLAMSSFSMACIKDPEVIRNQVKDAIIKNGLEKTKVMSMYENCKLRANVKDFEKRRDIELNNTSTYNQDNDAVNAKYWYRGMSRDEYILLDRNGYNKIPCVEEESYCGIAPQYTYAKTYPKSVKPKITIEFSTEGLGWLYNEFTTKNKCQTKAEGGGTYGLGRTGTSGDKVSSCVAGYKVGVEFNNWLSGHKIQSQVSYVLLPKNP